MAKRAGVLTPKQESYVYALVDPRNGERFYIGKGTGRRIHCHEQEVRSGKEVNPKKAKRILEIWAAGFEVEHELIASGLTDAEALAIEKSHIQSIGLESLANISPGTMDSESRARIHAANLLARMLPFVEWVRRRNPPLWMYPYYWFAREGFKHMAKGRVGNFGEATGWATGD